MHRFRRLFLVCASAVVFCSSLSAEDPAPAPPGVLVDLGGHKLHVHCTGKSGPTVLVETGFGDFSFDWILVQERVSHFARICTYDRAGYAWSDPGPLPRTFAQINLELHDALNKLGERGPYVLVGHSYGGPAMRNFAATYPRDVAGMVLVDAAHEGMRISIGGKNTVRLGEGAKAMPIPEPHEQMRAADRPTDSSTAPPPPPQPLEPLYQKLPASNQKLHLWAQNLSTLDETEDNERQWSEIYYAEWLAAPLQRPLGAFPLIVLTRAEGGYGEDFDVPAAQMEKERKQGQAKLLLLSSNSSQIVLPSGHNMEIEDPDGVAAAIRRVVDAANRKQSL